MQRNVIVVSIAVAFAVGLVVWIIVGSRSAPVAAAGDSAVSTTPTSQHAFVPPSAPDVTPHTLGRADAAAPSRPPPEGKRRGYDRLRADAIRKRAAGRTAAQPAVPTASVPVPGSAPGVAADESPMTPREKERRRKYLGDAVREQYFPVAKSCYEELLLRQPRAAGKVVMSFAIVSDGTDGVVDRVELDEGTTMTDPDFLLCMRESMYTTIFEPPPPGAQETTVVYPVELSPDPPDSGAPPASSSQGKP